MKTTSKLILPLLPLIFFSFCTVKRKEEPRTTWNYLTLTTEEKTYKDTIGVENSGGEVVASTAKDSTDEMNSEMEECVLQKSATGSVFSFVHMGRPAFPWAIKVFNAAGPANGVGMFKITNADLLRQRARVDSMISMNHVQGASAFVAQVNDDRQYPIDSMNINILKADGSVIEADYIIWISSLAEGEKITGHISWHTASIK
jgi:hypothetical protein